MSGGLRFVRYDDLLDGADQWGTPVARGLAPGVQRLAPYSLPTDLPASGRVALDPDGSRLLVLPDPEEEQLAGRRVNVERTDEESYRVAVLDGYVVTCEAQLSGVTPEQAEQVGELLARTTL